MRLVILAALLVFCTPEPSLVVLFGLLAMLNPNFQMGTRGRLAAQKQPDNPPRLW